MKDLRKICYSKGNSNSYKGGYYENKISCCSGRGAVGSYVIWGLSEKKDIRLGVIASGERAKRLKNKGCKINDTVYHPEVWTPEEAHGVDFLIVSLKYGALPGALDDITAVTGENTVIMSLMNGVDSEEIIAEKPVRSICFMLLSK